MSKKTSHVSVTNHIINNKWGPMAWSVPCRGIPRIYLCLYSVYYLEGLFYWSLLGSAYTCRCLSVFLYA